MRSFSEERKNGTEQLLLTSPLSITKIVLGKFIAALIVALITEICTLMYFAILCHYGMPQIPTALVTLLGFLLFVTTYISFGMLASSITENQIIAAIISIAFFIITWVIPDFNSNLQGISFINMLYKYTKWLKEASIIVIGTKSASINAHQSIVPITIENKNPSFFNFNRRRRAYPDKNVPPKNSTAVSKISRRIYFPHF